MSCECAPACATLHQNVIWLVTPTAPTKSITAGDEVGSLESGKVEPPAGALTLDWGCARSSGLGICRLAESEWESADESVLGKDAIGHARWVGPEAPKVENP